MKKIVLVAAGGLMTTATIVYGAFDKKPAAAVKTETVKKQEVKKKSNCSKSSRSMCGGYYRTT